VKADFKLSKKRMAMARDDHVLVTIESDSDCVASAARGQCGKSGGQCCLRFFSAGTPAASWTLDHDFVDWQVEDVRYNHLYFRRMLSGGSDKHGAVFARFRPRRLGLQIKMFLAAKVKCAAQFQRRF